jgi:hypothetical protein
VLSAERGHDSILSTRDSGLLCGGSATGSMAIEYQTPQSNLTCVRRNLLPQTLLSQERFKHTRIRHGESTHIVVEIHIDIRTLADEALDLLRLGAQFALGVIGSE